MPKPRRKTPDQEANEMARALLPAAQAVKGDFSLVDVQNFSEADQRHMKRSGQIRTIRRKTRLEKLYLRKLLTVRELLACEWYQAQHEAENDTLVRIADWQASSPSSDKAFGHWPAGMILEPGQSMLEWAREAIPPIARPMFDRIVIQGQSAGKWGPAFKLVAARLLEHIEGKVEL